MTATFDNILIFHYRPIELSLHTLTPFNQVHFSLCLLYESDIYFVNVTILCDQLLRMWLAGTTMKCYWSPVMCAVSKHTHNTRYTLDHTRSRTSSSSSVSITAGRPINHGGHTCYRSDHHSVQCQLKLQSGFCIDEFNKIRESFSLGVGLEVVKNKSNNCM